MDAVTFLSPLIRESLKKKSVKRHSCRIMNPNRHTVSFVVAVDIREGSPTFGQHVAVELTEENHRQFFIPRGCAHGFSVLSKEVIFQYKCDNFYAPQHEGAIAWDDPDLGIDWKIPVDKILLSEKDKIHPRLIEIV